MEKRETFPGFPTSQYEVGDEGEYEVPLEYLLQDFYEPKKISIMSLFPCDVSYNWRY